MLIELNFKTPDVIDNALANIQLNENEYHDLTEELNNHIKYSEYLTVYYNTKTKKLQLEA